MFGLLGLNAISNSVDLAQAMVEDSITGSTEETRKELKRQRKQREQIVDAVFDFYDDLLNL